MSFLGSGNLLFSFLVAMSDNNVSLVSHTELMFDFVETLWLNAALCLRSAARVSTLRVTAVILLLAGVTSIQIFIT